MTNSSSSTQTSMTQTSNRRANRIANTNATKKIHPASTCRYNRHHHHHHHIIPKRNLLLLYPNKTISMPRLKTLLLLPAKQSSMALLQRLEIQILVLVQVQVLVLLLPQQKQKSPEPVSFVWKIFRSERRSCIRTIPTTPAITSFTRTAWLDTLPAIRNGPRLVATTATIPTATYTTAATPIIPVRPAGNPSARSPTTTLS